MTLVRRLELAKHPANGPTRAEKPDRVRSPNRRCGGTGQEPESSFRTVKSSLFTRNRPTDPKSKNGRHPAAPIRYENQERRAVRRGRSFAYTGSGGLSLAEFGCTMAARGQHAGDGDVVTRCNSGTEPVHARSQPAQRIERVGSRLSRSRPRVSYGRRRGSGLDRNAISRRIISVQDSR